jgi:2-aminoadipate transaminase
MQIELNSTSNEAVYHQIVRQIKDQISTGRLTAGTRLPSIRGLAAQLQLNHLTVENAYSQLQADGWVSSEVGRGTFVIPSDNTTASPVTLEGNITPNALMADLFNADNARKPRSLARSSPDLALSSLDEFWGALLAQRRDVALAGAFSPTEGDELLRRELAMVLKERGIQADFRDIIVTSGATQAIALSLQTVTNPGDTVLIPEPTYVGLFHTIRTLGRTVLSMPYEPSGDLDLAEVEKQILQGGARAIILSSVFNNPTGYSLPESTKGALIELAEHYGIYLIEDDVYGLITYQTSTPFPIRAIAASERIIFLTSLSKVLMPGLRIGYMAVPPSLRNRLVEIKRAVDVMGVTLIHRAVAFYLQNGALKNYLRRALPTYQERRDAMLRALGLYLPPSTTWTTPSGGFSIWVRLHQPIVSQVYQAAVAQDILFAPGSAFVGSHDDNHHFRLSFGHPSGEEIQSIVQLLGGIIKETGGR